MRTVAAVVLFFAALTAAVHRDLLLHLDRAIYIPPASVASDGPPLGSFARGDQFLHIWALATNLRHLREDPAAIFEANGFYPQPRSLFFSDHLFGEALFLLPVTVFTTDPVLLHNLALLLSFVLSGVGLTFLVRLLSGSVLAGIVAGVAWAFSPPRSFEIFQLQLLTTQWIPFVFLLVHRTIARPRLATALGAAAFLCLQMLSGIYVGTYLVLCLVPFMAIQLLTAAPRAAWGAGWRLAMTFSLAAVATAPWFVQYLRVRAALGEYGGLLENVGYGLSLQHYVLPSWLLGMERFPGPLGVAVGVLAGLGVVAGRWRVRGARWAYALTALWAAALSLGPYVRYGAGPEWASSPGFLGPGPYAMLYAVLPGLDALRVPARMSLLAGFFLAVLAGLGASRIVGWARQRRGRLLIAAALAGCILGESRPRAPGIEVLPVGDRIPPVYRWLRERGDGGAVVELPVNVLKDPSYLYYSTGHWHPLVNGYGAYLPPLYLYLQRELQRLPDPAAVDALREIGVRYVVAHGGPALDGAGGLAQVAAFGDDVVYQVSAEPPGDHTSTPEPALREIRSDRWVAMPGANPDQGALAFDGDVDTAWSNVGDLAVAPVLGGNDGLAWLRALDTWPAYRRAYQLEDRPRHFTIDLGETVRPARVEVLLHVHQTPIFAPLVLSTSMDGATFERLDCAWHPAASLQLYATAPAATWLEARCAGSPARFLRLDQEPASFRIYWELAELRLLVND